MLIVMSIILHAHLIPWAFYHRIYGVVVSSLGGESVIIILRSGVDLIDRTRIMSDLTEKAYVINLYWLTTLYIK